jgi:DNA-binding CsgD family transcriptional regulator
LQQARRHAQRTGNAVRRQPGLGEAQVGLTTVEAGVVVEVIQGGSREDVARRLGVAVATVRTHLARIFERTGVRRQAELVRLALNGDTPLR